MALTSKTLLDFQYRSGDLLMSVKCTYTIGAVSPINHTVSVFDSRSAPPYTVTAFGEDGKGAMSWALGLRSGMMSAAKEDMAHCTAEVIAHLANCT
ncbi:MAG: hypothetical protein RSE62_03475 [Citrobacter sp.]